MKKLIAIILTISFVLCLVPVTFSVSAAETSLNIANKGWKVTRGDGYFYTDENREFYWKADGAGNTYDWPAVHNGSLEEGTITATVSASGNIGIFFGAEGISDNVKDGVSNLTGAENTRYSWIALQVDPTTKAAYLRLFYDDDVTGGAALLTHSDSSMPLNNTTENATKYGIDGTSDVELKVEFTKSGLIKAYVNGVLVITRSPSSGNARPTFGSEYGMMVLNSKYGAENANTEVGYVKSFSTQGDISAFNKWYVRRGGSSWAAVDGGEFLWTYVADGTNGRTWNNLIQYYKDLEEGSVSATVAKDSRIGIAFAGTGFANVKEGSGGALADAQDCKYYWAVVDWDGNAGKYCLALKVDSSDTAGTWTTVERVDISDIGANDYTIKVDFTKNGDIKVSLNGEELISVTGQTIYGKQLGMITTTRGPLAGKAGQTAGTVKAFTIATPHVCAPEYVEAVAPTCTVAGTIAHYACDCGKLYSDAEGTLEIDNVVDPINENNHVKTTPGYDEEAHWNTCDACGEVVGKALHDIDANAFEGECSGCDYAKVHTCELAFVQGTPATCMATGTLNHYKCNDERCGKTYSDADGENEINDLVAPIDINNHTEVLSYDYDEDGHWQICECKTVFSIPYDHVYENGVDGDCTVCDYYKVPVHVCAPENYVEGREANCCISGIVEHWICECGKYYLDEACTIPTTADDVDFDADLSDIANHVIVLDETKWSYGSDHHWKECACGEKFEYAEHDGLYCSVCKFYMTGVYEKNGELYFLEYTGKHLTGKFYVTENASNGLVKAGWYYANESGKFYNKEVVEIDGKLYYFENGQGANGIHLVNGSYYCSLWTGEVRTGKIYVTTESASTLEGFKSGWYYADENGAFYNNEFVEIENETYYLVKGQGISNGVHLITIDEVEKFFCFDHRGRLRTGKFYITVASTNGIEGFNGWHNTDESGAIID